MKKIILTMALAAAGIVGVLHASQGTDAKPATVAKAADCCGGCCEAGK